MTSADILVTKINQVLAEEEAASRMVMDLLEGLSKVKRELQGLQIGNLDLHIPRLNQAFDNLESIDNILDMLRDALTVARETL